MINPRPPIQSIRQSGFESGENFRGFHGLIFVWAHEEAEVVGEDFLRMDYVLSVSPNLLEKALDLGRVKELRARRIVFHFARGAGLNDEELELQVIEKFSSALDVVPGGTGKQDWDGGHLDALVFHADPVIVLGRIWIGDPNQGRRKGKFVATVKSDRCIKLFFSDRIMARENVEQLMSD